MVVDVACLDTAGTVIAHLPAITRTISHDNKHSQAASFTKARTHACVLARQLQDSQSDIKELLTEVADWQKVASETTAQLQQRDLQVADLRRQLKEPKPRSRLGLASRHPSGPPKAEGTAPAASDELGHLHTQVEGVENTIAILSVTAWSRTPFGRRLPLWPEHKDQVMQLKREVKAQTGQADEAQARAASVQRAHDRVAQQLELARTELRQHGSDVSAKVAETKQQAAQELQNAREQLQLHSQLLQEQDEEVQKLRKLLEVQHEQMTAQEQHHSQEMKSLQECIRDQRQHAAELQQRAVRQEAEEAAGAEYHRQQPQQLQLSEEAGQPQRQLKQAESQMRQMKAELTLKKAVLREQRQELSHKDSLMSQCKEELHGLTTLVQQQRQELCTLERQATTQHQLASHHVHLMQKQQDALAEQSATVQKLQEQLGHSQEVTQAKQGELDSRSAELQQRQHVIHDQHAELRARSETILQLQTDLQRLSSVVKHQQKEMAVTGRLVGQHQQLLAEKELFLGEQHEQLLQQDGLLRQQRELLVNQDTALQAYKGGASPRARWGHIHLQLAHRFAQARRRRHLSALLNSWLFLCRHRQHQQNKLQHCGIRHSRHDSVTLWVPCLHTLHVSDKGSKALCPDHGGQHHFCCGTSCDPNVATGTREQLISIVVLQHWRSICTVRALLQQQGRAATHSLQLLRLKQAWQLWRRAHRAALAARQRQYSKMVYELLKELESSETVLHNKEQACKAAQYEVVSHQLQIEASRERLEGAKEEVGLSQEALLHEQQLTHGLQRQAREDIASADEAVGAVAQLLHQLAPDGDVHAAALALRQAKETAAGMLRLPKSLAQWAQTPSLDPMQGQGSLPSSRLSQILLKHFHLTRADRTRPALLQSSIHTDMHAAGMQSHYAASTSANPRVGPHDALPFQQQSEQAKDNQRKPRHPAPAAAAARQITVTGSRAEQLAKPAAAAGRLGRGTAAKQRPQSAGSNAVDVSKGKPALINKRKGRPRSVSPGSQYHFSCTSSVSDNACSWYGQAGTAMAQQGDLGKGRAGVRCPVQKPLWQTGADPGPVHSTYVLPDQLLMSPARNGHALRDQQVLRHKVEAQLRRQTEGFNSQGPQWLSDAVCDTQTGVQPAAGVGPHAEQQQHQQQDCSHHQQRGLMSPPATPGGCSMAPPLEPPSTIQPAGVPRAPLILSPFMQRVARQMQLDAELLSHSQTHTQAQQQMLQRDAESLSMDQSHLLAHRAEGFADQTQSHDVAQLMTDSVNGVRLHTKSMRALHKPEHGAQLGLSPQREQALVRLAKQASTFQVSPAATPHLQSQVTGLALPPSVASLHTEGSQQTSRGLHAARGDEQASTAKGSSPCQGPSQHAAERDASGQKVQTSRPSAVNHGQSSMRQKHSPGSRRSPMQGAGSKENCFLTPDASSKLSGVLPSSQQASNSIGDGHCMRSVGSGKAMNDGARIAEQHVADSTSALSKGLGTADGEEEGGPDVFDAATGRPLSMDALSNASLLPGTTHASCTGLPDQTGQDLGGLLLHMGDPRSASLQGCGDAQLADQQGSQQLELLSKHQRASPAQQPAAPRQHIQQQSPSQLDSSGMHHLHSSPVREQNKSSAILQSLGNQRLAFVEGLHDQASQEKMHQKSVGSCALPIEACSEDISKVIAGKARSSLKGSNAWPPPSPSPKKLPPSPKHPSAYPKKAACSQNRQPARGLQGVSQAATLQRHTDVMALHQRLRSHSSASSSSQSRIDR
ncbi:MAG: hypothetical protein FRX49_04591 [Trebouxia sp. A1-2]|nr:MAG: hypothetical protein FRX49_04591 [Trebouxia sp. A1-2]